MASCRQGFQVAVPAEPALKNTRGDRSNELASGKHTKSYGKWPFKAIEIVSFPIKNGDFP